MLWNLAHSPVQITLFWRLMKGQPLFDKELSEWERLSHIAIALLGSVADERTFSTMKCVTEQRPSLTTHSELTLRAGQVEKAANPGQTGRGY